MVRACGHCGAEVIRLLRGRRRKFCSDKCRLASHRRTKARSVRSGAPALAVAAPNQTPEQWADAVRQAYELSATESQLLDLAVLALTMSRDGLLKPETRLTATGRYQLLIKQLHLEVPEESHGEVEKTGADVRPWPRPVAG